MKQVIQKDGVFVLQDSQDEMKVREAQECEAADFELLLHGSPDVKDLVGILQRSLIRLLALERERK